MKITRGSGSTANPTLVIVITQAELKQLRDGGYLYASLDSQPVYLKATSPSSTAD